MLLQIERKSIVLTNKVFSLINHFSFKTFCMIYYVSCDYIFVCLFGVYRATREFFTHMETSPLSVQGCKF